MSDPRSLPRQFARGQRIVIDLPVSVLFHGCKGTVESPALFDGWWVYLDGDPHDEPLCFGAGEMKAVSHAS